MTTVTTVSTARRATPRSAGWLTVALVAWSVASVAAAALPVGTGGDVRVVNAVVFLTLAPGIAAWSHLRTEVPPLLAAVASAGGSLSLLVVVNAVLLALGGWSVLGVAAVIGTVTVLITVLTTVLGAPGLRRWSR